MQVQLLVVSWWSLEQGKLLLQTLAQGWKEVLFQICISEENNNHHKVKEGIFNNCPYLDGYLRGVQQDPNALNRLGSLSSLFHVMTFLQSEKSSGFSFWACFIEKVTKRSQMVQFESRSITFVPFLPASLVSGESCILALSWLRSSVVSL